MCIRDRLKDKDVRMHATHNSQWVQSDHTVIRRALFIHAINAHDLYNHKGKFNIHKGTANALCYAPEIHYKKYVIPDARVLFRRPYLTDRAGVGEEPLAADTLLNKSVKAAQGFALPPWQYKGDWGVHNMPRDITG